LAILTGMPVEAEAQIADAARSLTTLMTSTLHDELHSF
jgi:hypothetical protein